MDLNSYYRKASDFIKSLPLKSKILLALVFALILLFLFNSIFLSPPRSFESETVIRVEEGSTLSQTAIELKEKRLIKSEFWFKVFVILTEDGRSVKAGDYYFEKPISTFKIANRLAKGLYSLDPIRVTIPEGLNVFQIADLFAGRFDLFNKDEFIKNAPEGFLFPDTYFFLPNVSAEEAIRRMTLNFNQKIEGLSEEIELSGKTLEKIIIMASIIEEEAISSEDRRIVSGILWNRFSIGMALQVDSTFIYVNGKNTYELTHDDLEIDSPYNSYRNIGFPPTPISNPGMDSIIASINPKPSDYFYFLSDLAGNMYYAEDFDGHQINREKYLRR